MIFATIISGIVSVIGIGLAAFFKGRSYALNSARKKALEDAGKARDVANNVNASSDSDIDKRLREWSGK